MVRKTKLTFGKVLAYIFLSVTAFSTIYPIVFTLFSSFKDRFQYMTNMFGPPGPISFNNFRAIFQNMDIYRMLLNSFFVASAATILSLIINSMAAFSLAKLRYKGRNFIFLVIMFVLMVPTQALMLPIYMIFSNLRLVNSFASVIIIYTVTTIAFSTYLLHQNCADIPDEIIEAARVDGAGYPRIYLSIVTPMLSPTLATLAILNFLGFWNETVYTRLLLQKPSLYTMTLGLLSMNSQYGVNVPLISSGMLINMTPALVVFIIFNKYLSKGVTMGSGK